VAEDIGTDRGRLLGEIVKRRQSRGGLGKEMMVIHAGDEGQRKKYISAFSEIYVLFLFVLATCDKYWFRPEVHENWQV